MTKKLNRPLASASAVDSKKSENWLIVGDGRLAKHLMWFLPKLTGKKKNLKPHLSQWSRGQNAQQLADALGAADRVLLAISDSALEAFYKQHKSTQPGKIWVHFSGALHIPDMLSAHPLMSFSDNLYPLRVYQQLLWVVEEPHALQDVLPGLHNPSISLSAEKKSLYHSACVMVGNLPIFWMNEGLQLFQELQIPKQSALQFVERAYENWKNSPATALTGPLARKDRETLQKHLVALKNHPQEKTIRSLYESVMGEKL